MQRHNYKPVGGQGEEMDRLLDAALKEYAAVEPRAGLEDRVLAQVRSGLTSAPGRSWWHWGIAAAALTALALIIAMVWRPRPEPQPKLAQHPSLSVPEKVENSPESHGGQSSVQRVAIKRAKSRSGRTAVAQVAEAAPKLDQFPSPQPLTPQEKRLAAYVGQHYEEAVLIARARDDQLEQDRIQDEAEESQMNRSNQNTH
jgi:hypothetical protein